MDGKQQNECDEVSYLLFAVQGYKEYMPFFGTNGRALFHISNTNFLLLSQYSESDMKLICMDVSSKSGEMSLLVK